MTQHTPLTPEREQEIRTLDLAPLMPDRSAAVISGHLAALLAEIDRFRDRVAELEAFAYGCDAEGCVLPHSSWCDAAKKTAAENDGCTCGQPWTGHPQPHAMHCWKVNPPRAEVEEMRRTLAELGDQNAKLIRWHREDGAYEQRLREQHDRDVAELNRLRARVRELERPAVEAKRKEIRDSFQELANAARETRDYEGAFDVECRLREREEQWAREDAAAVVVVAGGSGTTP